MPTNLPTNLHRPVNAAISAPNLLLLWLNLLAMMLVRKEKSMGAISRRAARALVLLVGLLQLCGMHLLRCL